MKLYYDLHSEPSTAVYLFLKCNNVEFEPHIVNVMTGENRSEEYQKINPFQLIPVIDDDGFVLTESIAIMRYIATKYNVAEHWFPKEDVQKQARVDEFLNWYHTNLRKSCIELLMTKLRTRVPMTYYPKIPYDVEKIKELQGNLTRTITHLDEYFLKDKPFIAGDEISAADLIGYCEMAAQSAIEDETYKSNEHVNAWMKRVASKLGKFIAEPLATLEQLKLEYANAKE